VLLKAPQHFLSFSIKLQEGVVDTLEELWISYNLIEKVKGINILRNLKVLQMTNNLIREWAEYSKLSELPALEELSFVGKKYHGTKLAKTREH
jgi:Leucine-rich repeat (LRR) protein